jgi:ATP-dependent DNA helicase RecQ
MNRWEINHSKGHAVLLKPLFEQLQMRDPYNHIGSFDRPNLEYHVIHCLDKYEKMRKLINAIKGHTLSIVYVRTQADTDGLVVDLRRAVITALAYHAGLKKADRAEAQRKFLAGEVDVLVATIAFDMGIDKANIRSVIHFDIPDSIERYHQETGRAGRDGLPAQCTLIYNEKDVDGAKYIIERIPHSLQYLELLLSKLTQMQQIATNGMDIREQMLSYFTNPI